MPPTSTFRVNLAARFWVRCHVWQLMEDAPEADGLEAAYFLATPTRRKIGDIHFSVKYLDLDTITHEAYHAIAELRRRVEGAHTHEGEEWCAQQQERLIRGIVAGVR